MPLSLPPFASQVGDARYCHFRPVRGEAGGLVAACAGVERCLPEYRVNRTGFACFGLEFVAAGEGELVLDRQRHALFPGSAFLYGPGVPHEIRTDPRRQMRKYFVDFFGRGAGRFLRDVGLAPGEVRRVDDLGAAETLFEGLVREGERSGERARESADAYLRLLLYKVAELPAHASGPRSAGYLTWRRCQDVLERDYLQLKGLRELCERARLHPSHLCRLYKHFGGTSPHGEITRRKMNHAATLLATTSMLVKDVAQQVGYEDPLHFSRLFRQHFGRPPTAFQETENRARRA